jgi:integrase
MGSVRVRQDTGALFLDFTFERRRIRQQTDLPDTPANRRRLQKKLARIESQIDAGKFVCEKATPNDQFNLVERRPSDVHSTRASANDKGAPSKESEIPKFADFAKQWLAENEVQWRRSYRITQRGTFDKYLVPHFGHRRLNEILKAEILAFRADLSQLPGRLGATLSARRINAIMKPLRQLMNEAAERYKFSTPFQNIRPLKMKRSDVMPFSLDEVQRILSAARPDVRCYLTVRFFTGLRSGEAHGLKWKNVDFERRMIFVRESLVLGEEDDLKTEGSQRDIGMSQIVFEALSELAKPKSASEYVFTNSIGGPIDNKNFVNRVWNPLLDRLGLTRRRPYQMRHTAATIWLAAGEAPEWIAC